MQGRWMQQKRKLNLSRRDKGKKTVENCVEMLVADNSRDARDARDTMVCWVGMEMRQQHGCYREGARPCWGREAVGWSGWGDGVPSGRSARAASTAAPRGGCALPFLHGACRPRPAGPSMLFGAFGAQPIAGGSSLLTHLRSPPLPSPIALNGYYFLATLSKHMCFGVPFWGHTNKCSGRLLGITG